MIVREVSDTKIEQTIDNMYGIEVTRLQRKYEVVGVFGGRRIVLLNLANILHVSCVKTRIT